MTATLHSYLWQHWNSSRAFIQFTSGCNITGSQEDTEVLGVEKDDPINFFRQEENAWPITIKLPEPSVEDPEVSATNWIGLVYGPAEENRLRSLLERNSNYDVVMRIIAWILRFILHSKLKLLDRDKSRIGVKCIQHAANHCIKYAQLEIYSEEIEA
ncbi:hypothetical protein OUZ56_033299 [Daphnia magna]|uniref:Uncharacterized protein n=1 Tax=Daphnia magna TaxID=35525 RepID=A0ABR0BAL3_9CRUS|nr:hypothetical protein OUZ56_033299 [Daphnia magna]